MIARLTGFSATFWPRSAGTSSSRHTISRALFRENGGPFASSSAASGAPERSSGSRRSGSTTPGAGGHRPGDVSGTRHAIACTIPCSTMWRPPLGNVSSLQPRQCAALVRLWD